MKRTLPFIAAALWAGYLVAADSNPKAALENASKNLADKANYGWKTTVEVPGDPDGTIVGKTEKNRATFLALARAEVTFDGVLKDGKGALKTEEGWKSLAEAATTEGSQSGAVRFVAALLQNFKVPPAEVSELAGKVKDLKETDGAYVGELTEQAAKDLLLYRTGRRGNGPDVSGAKGSVKFWVKDGLLSKYEFKLHGTLSMNGNEREVDRTHTTEIKEIGTTQVSIPEEAAKKL